MLSRITYIRGDKMAWVKEYYYNVCLKLNIEEAEMIDKCPVCHKNIVVDDVTYVNNDKELIMLTVCPNAKCQRLFVTRYEAVQKLLSKDLKYWKKAGQWPSNAEVDISESINIISSGFSEIYGQATKAKELGLSQICGVGYRKALEYLIRDYCIYFKKDSDENIKKKPLENVIDTYIDNNNIKQMAKRAVWLGNDETHYTRKWIDRDVEDLIKLIDLTMKWIDLEYTTQMYNQEMEKSIK